MVEVGGSSPSMSTRNFAAALCAAAFFIIMARAPFAKALVILVSSHFKPFALPQSLIFL